MNSFIPLLIAASLVVTTNCQTSATTTAAPCTCKEITVADTAGHTPTDAECTAASTALLCLRTNAAACKGRTIPVDITKAKCEVAQPDSLTVACECTIPYWKAQTSTDDKAKCTAAKELAKCVKAATDTTACGTESRADAQTAADALQTSACSCSPTCSYGFQCKDTVCTNTTGETCTDDTQCAVGLQCSTGNDRKCVAKACSEATASTDCGTLGICESKKCKAKPTTTKAPPVSTTASSTILQASVFMIMLSSLLSIL